MARHRHDPSKDLVGFLVGDVMYAVRIDVVREIVNPLGVVELPRAPKTVKGVADYRGEVVPVIDLRERFGLPAVPTSRKTKWIVLDVGAAIGARRRASPPSISGGRYAALVVDAVTEVFGLGGGELRPAPPLGAGDDAARHRGRHDARRRRSCSCSTCARSAPWPRRRSRRPRSSIGIVDGAVVTDRTASVRAAARDAEARGSAPRDAGDPGAARARVVRAAPRCARRRGLARAQGSRHDRGAGRAAHGRRASRSRARSRSTTTSASATPRSRRSSSSGPTPCPARSTRSAGSTPTGASSPSRCSRARRRSPGCARSRARSRDPDVNVVVAVAEGARPSRPRGRRGARARDARRSTELLASARDARCALAALEALRALGADVPWSRPRAAPRRSALATQRDRGRGGQHARRARSLALAEAHRAIRARRSRARRSSRSVARSRRPGATTTLARRRGEDAARVARGARTPPCAREGRRRDPGARGAAILALGLVRDPDDVALIADALADDAVADRAEAALASSVRTRVEPLLVAGRSAAPSLRGATISMLPGSSRLLASPQPLAAVREALADASPEVVAPALKSLAIVGGRGRSRAGRAATSRAPIRRWPPPRTARSSRSRRAMPSAARGDARRRRSARRRRARGAIVLDALAAPAPRRPRTPTFLASALTHREAAVRRAAIEALASIGGEDAARAVTFSLADEEAVVALAAIRALGRLGRAEQLALARGDDEAIRCASAPCLRALRDADPERAFAAARPLLRSREPRSPRRRSRRRRRRVEARVEALMGATDHPDHEVVKLALGELANSATSARSPRSRRAIDHAAEAVRKLRGRAARSRRRRATAESILRARLDRERSADVRHAIIGTRCSARPATARVSAA